MKKMMIALVVMLTMAATGKAMSYEQARNEALFLTDKMAYELNLTDEQYEAAYEINLDYLMGVTSYDDVYGTYWERRNLDISYILLDWQWNAFRAATYFYRPLYWEGGYWHFGIYARYPHRDYFYFGRPAFYASYRGGHAWHVVGGYGYYYSRRTYFVHVDGRRHFGMHDRWNRGDLHHRHLPSRHFDRPSGVRSSSTRTTVHSQGRFGSFGNSGQRSYDNNRDRAFGGRLNGSTTRSSIGGRSSMGSGMSRSSMGSGMSRSSMGSGMSRSSMGGGMSRSSMGGRSGAFGGSFNSGRSSSSFGGGRSFGGGGGHQGGSSHGSGRFGR